MQDGFWVLLSDLVFLVQGGVRTKAWFFVYSHFLIILCIFLTAARWLDGRLSQLSFLIKLKAN
jgi:hypothetical protein